MLVKQEKRTEHGLAADMEFRSINYLNFRMELSKKKVPSNESDFSESPNKSGANRWPG